MSAVTPLGHDEIARRSVEGRVDVRAEPLRVRIELPPLLTRDRHDLRCALECSVRAADDRNDRHLLAEMLLSGRETVRREDVAAHLSRRTKREIESFVASQNVQDLLHGDQRAALEELMRQKIDAAAFATGLLVLPPFQLDLESHSHQRAQIEHFQRQRSEERAAEQVQHLRRASDLLQQFQSLRERSGTISPGRILEQISPADRGGTLDALMLASSADAQHATLWAVAGPSLVKIDPRSVPPKVELHTPPTKLGPLRSVQPATIDGIDVLLLGAQSGVMVIDPNSFDVIKELSSPRSDSQFGFNRVVFDQNTRTIFASHQDFGLIRWHADSGEVQVIDATPGARHLQAMSSGKVVYAIGPKLAFVPPREPSNSPANVIGIAVDSSRAIVTRDTGAVEILDRATGEPISQLQRPGRLCASASLPWLGTIRLLLGREDGAIDCAGIDDQLVTQYISVHHGCKMLAACTDVVAAVSSDRQRLILWHTWDGRKPFAELHVTAQTRHRIGDIDWM